VTTDDKTFLVLNEKTITNSPLPGGFFILKKNNRKIRFNLNFLKTSYLKILLFL